MKIQELAQQSGLSVYTIRFYEKQGLLDSRHVVREENRYRNYSDLAIERLNMVKKFQGIGCSLEEIREILQSKDDASVSNAAVVDWIRQKICDVERKKEEYDQILETLHWMLDYRIALNNDPQKADALLAARHPAH